MFNDKAGLKLFVGAMLLLLESTLATNAETLYSETFSGTAATNLNTTAPDVSSTPGATWSAGTTIKKNGSIALSAANFTGLLPFTPQPGNVYTLSSTIVTTSSGTTGTLPDNWIGLGFTQALGTLGTRWQDSGAQPVAWAMSRTNTASTQTPTPLDMSFLGFANATPGATNGGLSGPAKSADLFTMTLDTSNPDWVWTVDFSNNGVDRTETLPLVPNIGFVGYSMNGPVGNSSVDNFLLTRVDSAVPVNKWSVNGGGNIGDNGSWSQGTPTAGSGVVFGDILTSPNAPALVNMNVATSLGSIQFSNTQQYAIQNGATLTLTGALPVISTIYGTHEIDAPIDGVNGFKKTGSGTLVLTNNSNTFTGDVLINQGVLEITKLGAINQLSGSVNVLATGTLRFGGNSTGGGASGDLSEPITGAGAIRLNSTLTTESINFTVANPTYSGAVSIGGGTLRVQDAGALGTTGTTPATQIASGTSVDGGAATGKLELANVNVIGERLQIEGKTSTNPTPHLTASGTSSWTGPIVGIANGSQFNLEAQAGSTLTITGDITLPEDTTARFLNLSGPAGSNGRIEGKIVDRTTLAQNINVSVVKKGLGTWTMAHASGSEFEFNNKDTIVEQGTLAVQSNVVGGVGDNGELWSRTIQIRSLATFDVSTFGIYSLQVEDPTPGVPGDEIGQEVNGSGTINAGVGHTFQAYDDSIITPGDNVGTLHINGNYKYSTFTGVGTGRWNYQLGATTSPAVSDQVVVTDGNGTGTATIDASDANARVVVNVSPYQGTLAQGAYALVAADSVGGTAASSNYNIKIRDFQNNDISSGVRQTFSVDVNMPATALNLNVTGTSADLSWDGSAGSVWDVKNTNNWTGTGGPQFYQLDKVTFGDVANKSVTINTKVAPGSVTFNGGVGSTYVVSGTGGMTGYGPINISSGIVRLQNTGNATGFTTTIAPGARLEMPTATIGTVVANGTMAVIGNTASTLIDNFNDGNNSEYVTKTVLDNTPGVGPPDDVAFSNTGTGMTANGFQSASTSGHEAPGAEQALALRAAALGVGQTLVVDANFNSTPGVSFAVVGIAIADSAAQVDSPDQTGNPAPTSYSQRKSYITSAMRLMDTPDGHDGRSFKAGTPTSEGATTTAAVASVGTITQLWITRTSNTDYTVGYSKDNMATRVTNPVTITNMDWTPDSVGFYADIRGLSPNIGAMDNLRIAPSTINKLQINGDLTLGSTGTLELNVGQDAFDMVAVTGAATLAGTIDVIPTGDFAPVNGQTFTILTAAGGITNAGVTYDLPANFIASIVGSTSLVLTYSLSGDFNGDTFVNAADYTTWRKTSTDPLGYTAWRENFGTAGAGVASGLSDPAAVPEPSTMMTLILGCCFATVWKRPRTRSANRQG